MRTLLIFLVVLLGALQWRLWFSDASLPGIWQKEERLSDLTMSQDSLSERNRKLAAEVDDLKTGLGAVEARARLDLGLIGPHESFYQVIEDTRPDQITPVLVPRDPDLGGGTQSVPTTSGEPGAATSATAHPPSVMTARGR
ncbi:MAG TPA: septum formation initiator family protein [Halothiobacillus sp.]|jgi:cell division protein FtsB|nr:septum formation initiator family protein [Halothiobacillus sp.]